MLTFFLIGLTALVSWQAFERPNLLQRLILWPPAIDRNKQFDRLLTHGFIHADWSHLMFNMLTLFFFGRGVEGVMTPLHRPDRIRAVLPDGDSGGDPADLPAAPP